MSAASTMREPAQDILSRPAPGIITALFLGYLCVGMPLPVIPLFLHDHLGFDSLTVGLVIGVQFVATVLTRGYAGRITDEQGGKRSALIGGAVLAIAGLLYLIAALPGFSPVVSIAIVVAGRLAAGFGESSSSPAASRGRSPQLGLNAPACRCPGPG
ncbi:MFS transporter [Agrobacterium pusense]|uniref:MFS transporter n=1 Tax=Agrobacterium pusense TaxID=648995 RepID=UPI003FD66F09